MNTRSTRVIFFGTPDFAVSSLEALYASGYDIAAVVTQPDKPVGRKQVLTPSAVKICAQSHHTPVIQPQTLKKEKASGATFLEQFKNLKVDIAIVVAYGKIIPEYYLSVPTYGFINVHGSILPEFRGPSPIHAAILQGLTHTGVTIMQLDAGMDTGAILTTRIVDIAARSTTAELHDVLKITGAQALVDTLPRYIDGDIQPIPQDEKRATYCHIITKEDGHISLSDDARVNDRKIRAYTPWPGAYCIVEKKRVKILSARVEENHLVIERVQPEGKKPMMYDEYLKGNTPLC
ncbi:MAG: methionyl-tRNA formyltransferase [Candidatus Kerfeldbacteria bacterium]|nr:methionyl-tRNA formyltransferase [Candidatus Kerfeldbacteria bacterium]